MFVVAVAMILRTVQPNSLGIRAITTRESVTFWTPGLRLVDAEQQHRHRAVHNLQGPKRICNQHCPLFYQHAAY